MGEVDFDRASFDGVISYDAMWHLPRHEHALVLARMRSWLTDGAPALLSLGATDAVNSDPSGLFTELLGAPTFYDAGPIDVSLEWLRTAGFTVAEHDCHPGPTAGHLIVLARAEGTQP